MLAILLALSAPQDITGPPAPAAQAQDETLAIPFDPPVGRGLRYRTTKSWQFPHEDYRVAFLHDYRFEAAPGGYRLWVELLTVEADPDDPRASAFEAAARPMVGVRYAILLDETGEPTGIEDHDRVWSLVLEGLEHIHASLESGRFSVGPHRAAADRILASFRRIGRDEQAAMLIGGAADLWAMAGRSLPLGHSTQSAEIAAPWGETVAMTGESIVTREDAGQASVHLSLSGVGTPTENARLRLTESTRYSLSAETGLVVAMEDERRTAPVDGEGQGHIERVRLERVERVPDV